MNIKELMDRVLFTLSVPKCVCCGEKLDYSDHALCKKCVIELKEFSTRNCPCCSKVLSECSCSNELLRSHFVPRVIKCYRYFGGEKTPANSIIYSLKQDNREDVLDFCSDLLLDSLNNSVDNLSECIFTNVPRRESAIIEYGIDHSAMLAKRIARKCGAEYIRLLESRAKKAQKSLDVLQRRQNADFRLVSSKDLSGRRVIIIDDIITTGASISNSATFIRSLGCKDITAACLAIAYNDKY